MALLSKTKLLASRLRSAGDPNRLAILRILKNYDRICVSEVARRLHLSIAVVSHHMQSLAKEKLVLPERHGKQVCYMFIKDAFVRDLIKLINKYTK